MPDDRVERLRGIRTFPQLVKYLRDDLRWPIEAENFDDLVFDWDPEDLGIDPHNAAKIEQIKQLRPLTDSQPWGIFFVKFEPKNLPIVALRRLLNSVVTKKRQTARHAEQRTWQLSDLLFISAYGEVHERHISFAHFSEPPEDRTQAAPSLRVLGWDGGDTALALEHVAYTLEAKLSWPSGKPDINRWRQSWSDAFVLRPREVVQTSQRLAERLAEMAVAIRRKAQAILKLENDRGPLTQLYKAFQESLLHDLTPDDFADTYAQTVCYGLFSAAVAKTELGAEEHELAGTLITNPFLREVLDSFLHVGGRKRSIDFDELGIQEVVDLLSSPDTHLDSILRDFGNQTRQEDPVMHFYEVFLSKYDKKRKVQRGVFYTPQPVVSYIVRSVHELLKTEFGIEDGLASTITWGEMVKRHEGLNIPVGTPEGSPFVQILDPATGTATFLVEVIDVIHRTLVKKWTKQGLNTTQINSRWNEYVPQHLLPRLHGYELMMAPYAIAHLKIGLKLHETGYRFGSPERVRVYLTNALEPASDIGQQKLAGLFPALAHEAQAVNEIKGRQRFAVVIGNPPYTVMSGNLSNDARSLVDSYRFVDGKRLKEKSMLRLEMHLQDDYIKFFRIGQVVIDNAGCGVFGYVSNHSFLDNPTLRGMRQSIHNTFSDLWLYDLHGNSKKKNDAPMEVEDKNVFDIQQGVAISLAIHLPCSQLRHSVRHADLFGRRDAKYRHLTTNTVSATTWNTLWPSSPSHLFIPQDSTKRAEFDKASGLLDIMPLNSCGVVSGREDLTYDMDQSALVERIALFCDPQRSDDWVRERFRIRDAGGYELVKRRRMVVGKEASTFIRRIDVKPFDTRWVAYTRGVLTSDQSNVMSHMLGLSNIGLIATRQTKEAWGVFVTRHPIAHKVISAYDVSSLFPLHLQPVCDSLNLSSVALMNLSRSFLQELADTLGVPQWGVHSLPSGLTPEDIFHYAYAVFHSPVYRSRYAEYLKTEFPRLPLTGHLELFRTLARLGKELMTLHLMESPKLDLSITEFIGPKNPEVEKVSFSGDTVWIDKAQKIGFIGVPEEVWSFHIGGYQVCEKWLKDRKGRTLSADDITHYQKIVVVLSETIRIMAEIDKVIDAHGGWPGAFIGNEHGE